MVRKDGAEARKERINNIARQIQAALTMNKQTGFIPLKKTVATIQLDTGLTEQKIMEYFDILQAAGQIELDVDNDKIKRQLV